MFCGRGSLVAGGVGSCLAGGGGRLVFFVSQERSLDVLHDAGADDGS